MTIAIAWEVTVVTLVQRVINFHAITVPKLNQNKSGRNMSLRNIHVSLMLLFTVIFI